MTLTADRSNGWEEEIFSQLFLFGPGLDPIATWMQGVNYSTVAGLVRGRKSLLSCDFYKGLSEVEECGVKVPVVIGGLL